MVLRTEGKGRKAKPERKKLHRENLLLLLVALFASPSSSSSSYSSSPFLCVLGAINFAPVDPQQPYRNHSTAVGKKQQSEYRKTALLLLLLLLSLISTLLLRSLLQLIFNLPFSLVDSGFRKEKILQKYKTMSSENKSPY